VSQLGAHDSLPKHDDTGWQDLAWSLVVQA
jgi:hypothetical protein